GLDPDDDGVLAELLRLGVREGEVGGPPEDDGDLGDPPTEPLAGPQVEGNPGPPTGVDVEPHGGIRLGRRVRGDAVLLEIAGHFVAALPAGGVLSPDGALGEVVGDRHRGEDLLLLAAQRVGVEAHRVLHCREGEELEEVVLDDVPCRADAVVVPGPSSDADVLGHGDLDVVDVVAVPHRLEHLVREAQREDVLDGLLAEVVVDPEDRVRREDRLDDVVELLRALEVVAEGLLDDDAPPRLVVGRRQAAALELLADDGEEVRRDREVEGVVAPGAALLVKLTHRLGEEVEGGVVVEDAGDESEALGQGAPDLLAEGRPGVLAHRVADDLAEVLVGPVTTGEADEGEPGREEAPVGEVVDRRQELLAGEVAGDPEEHEAARPRDPRQALVPRVPQRVDLGGDGGRAHARPPRRAASTSARPASCSVRWSTRTGRPRSARTAASPPAWAAMNSPRVNSRPGTGRSSRGRSVTWMYTPVRGPPLWYCPVEWRKRGPQPNVTGRRTRAARASTTPAKGASPSRSR